MVSTRLEPALEPNVTEILNQLELDPIKTIELAKSENINQKYLNQTEIAKSKKIFGSPTFIYSDEVFWEMIDLKIVLSGQI